MSPQISIIIPLYNKGPYVARALNSVISQTIQDFEIIVVDDKSCDEGPAIVRSFNDPRISIIDQDHHGVSFTRNHGADIAKSDFIAFLDADDEWTPYHLEILTRLRKRFPEAGVYSTAYQTVLLSGKRVHSKYGGIPESFFEGIIPNYFESVVLGNPPATMSNSGFLKELFIKMGGFPIDQNMGEDLDFLIKICLNYPVAFSSDIGAVIHEDSSHRACATYDFPIGELPYIKNAKKAVIDGIVSEKLLPYFKKYIERREIETALIHFYRRNYPAARIAFAQIKTHYFWFEKLKWQIIIRIPPSIIDRISEYKKSKIFK